MSEMKMQVKRKGEKGKKTNPKLFLDRIKLFLKFHILGGFHSTEIKPRK